MRLAATRAGGGEGVRVRASGRGGQGRPAVPFGRSAVADGVPFLVEVTVAVVGVVVREHAHVPRGVRVRTGGAGRGGVRVAGHLLRSEGHGLRATGRTGLVRVGGGEQHPALSERRPRAEAQQVVRVRRVSGV